MLANTTNWGRNGVKRVRLDPLDSSNPQNGSHKSLLERLNSAGEEKTSAPASVRPEEPRFMDVTAAFFGKQRLPVQEQEIKGQLPPSMPPPDHPARQQQPPHPRRHETHKHDKQHRPVINQSPVAKELREELEGAVAFLLLRMRSLCRSIPARLTPSC